MQDVEETFKTEEDQAVSESVWIQIAFTLDTKHYRVLWELAEEKQRTVPSLVRECVTRFLENHSAA